MRKSLTEDELKQREDKIAEAAMKLLREKGFENITMRELAKECHIASGTFFNYYPSKEALFQRLILNISIQYLDQQIEILKESDIHDFESYYNCMLYITTNTMEHHLDLLSLFQLRPIVYKQGKNENVEPPIPWLPKVLTLGDIVHEKYPIISTQDAIRFYYFLHALFIGYTSVYINNSSKKEELPVGERNIDVINDVKRYLHGLKYEIDQRETPAQ